MNILTEVTSHKFHLVQDRREVSLVQETHPVPLLALQQTQKLKFQIKCTSKSTESRNTLMEFWTKASSSTAVFLASCKTLLKVKHEY